MKFPTATYIVIRMANILYILLLGKGIESVKIFEHLSKRPYKK
jgi:hypothetical protein